MQCCRVCFDNAHARHSVGLRSSCTDGFANEKSRHAIPILVGWLPEKHYSKAMAGANAIKVDCQGLFNCHDPPLAINVCLVRTCSQIAYLQYVPGYTEQLLLIGGDGADAESYDCYVPDLVVLTCRKAAGALHQTSMNRAPDMY